jgi:hypothetical protein
VKKDSCFIVRDGPNPRDSSLACTRLKKVQLEGIVVDLSRGSTPFLRSDKLLAKRVMVMAQLLGMNAKRPIWLTLSQRNDRTTMMKDMFPIVIHIRTLTD